MKQPYYSSELYGEKVADYLNIENRLVDLERKNIPISATLIRKDYIKESKYVENFIYSDIIKKN